MGVSSASLGVQLSCFIWVDFIASSFPHTLLGVLIELWGVQGGPGHSTSWWLPSGRVRTSSTGLLPPHRAASIHQSNRDTRKRFRSVYRAAQTITNPKQLLKAQTALATSKELVAMVGTASCGVWVQPTLGKHETTLG